MKYLALGVLLSAYCSLGFASTTVSFYTKDQHGSIAGLTDATGNLTASTLNQYNDYGVNQSNNSNNNGQISINDDPYQYSGEYTDNESGLQPLGNGYRYYDPSLMRFISPDSYPLLNLYAYGSGNPIGNVDPTGHISQGASAWMGTGGAVAGIMGGVIGLLAAIATADPMQLVGAALGLTSAITGTASAITTTTNHEILGVKTGSAVDTALTIVSYATGIASMGVDAYAGLDFSAGSTDGLSESKNLNVAELEQKGERLGSGAQGTVYKVNNDVYKVFHSEAPTHIGINPDAEMKAFNKYYAESKYGCMSNYKASLYKNGEATIMRTPFIDGENITFIGGGEDSVGAMEYRPIPYKLGNVTQEEFQKFSQDFDDTMGHYMKDYRTQGNIKKVTLADGSVRLRPLDFGMLWPTPSPGEFAYGHWGGQE